MHIKNVKIYILKWISGPLTENFFFKFKTFPKMVSYVWVHKLMTEQLSFEVAIKNVRRTEEGLILIWSRYGKR